MSIADVEKPLLHHEEEKSSRLLVQIAFAIIGLATSVLWNQLMLCVVVLTQLFGKSALAESATAQNACCAAAMMVLTFGQRLLPAAQMTGKGRLLLCAASLFAMFSFGFVLASMVYRVDGAHEVFLLVVALNGLCTGMSQNLAASISTIYPGASGALLFGESMSPLVAVVISCITELSLQRNQRFAQAAAWTLVQAQAFVLVALLACLYLWLHGDAAAKPAQTVAECILEGGPAREYVLHRVAQLLCNAVVAFCCCCAWVFLLCTSPFIAEGLCGSKALCSSLLPQRMISISNMAATFGRLMGLKVGTQWLPSLVLESLMLLCFVLLLVFACIGGRLVEASFTAALATGLTMFGGLTLWSNFLLMRNDHSAQKSCGHSVILPCHVTTEVMWLAIQVGSIAGTCLAASL